MSDILDRMREVCISPMFTVDEQVVKVSNCSSSGTNIVSNGVEPQTVEVPKAPVGQRGTVDAQSIEPGEQPEGNTIPQQQKESTSSGGGGVGDWIKKNPIPTAIGVGALLLLLSKK